MYEVRIEGDTLRKLHDQFAKAPQIASTHLTRGMNQALSGYQGTAKHLAPVDKGLLRQGIIIRPTQKVGTQYEGSVEATARHSRWLEEGTGIYGPTGRPIRPKTKKALAWHRNGKWHFAKEVRGVRGRWYMRGSLQQNRNQTNQIFASTVNEIAKALVGGI